MFKQSPKKSYSFKAGKYRFLLPNQREITIECNKNTTIKAIQQTIYAKIMEQEPHIKLDNWRCRGHRIPLPSSFCQIAIPQLNIKPKLKSPEELLEIIKDANKKYTDAYENIDKTFFECQPSLDEVYHVNIAVPNVHESMVFLEEHEHEIVMPHKERLSREIEEAKFFQQETCVILDSGKKSSKCLLL